MTKPKGIKSIRNSQKGMIGPDNASMKSTLFDRHGFKACFNPFCRSDFTPKRRDQRFCCRSCKEAFFKVKYALLTLAPYFNVDPGEGMEGVD